jgi:hypothetical protein
VSVISGGCGFERFGLGDPAALLVVEDAAARDTAVVEDTQPRFDAEDPDTTTDAELPDTAPRDTAPACPESGGVLFEGHCYFLVATPKTFADARSACTAATAHLAAITSANEQAAIANLAGARDAWIGLRKDAAAPSTRSSFTWVTGELSLFDGWAPEDPNGGHNCARVRADRLWGDNPCDSPYAFVCERE